MYSSILVVIKHLYKRTGCYHHPHSQTKPTPNKKTPGEKVWLLNRTHASKIRSPVDLSDKGISTIPPCTITLARYSIAPNFCGTIFSWISWLTSRSRKFYSQNWRSQGGLYIYCTCWKMGEVTLNHKNLKWSRNFFMKIYFDTNLERFTKFLNHETLELYSTFTSKMPLKSADFLHKDMTYCHSGFSRGL